MSFGNNSNYGLNIDNRTNSRFLANSSYTSNKFRNIPIVAAYARLSRDEDRENYASIEEQINIIKDYAESRGWCISDRNIYIDDNVSGYTFNRPNFNQMLENVEKGIVDVVIAKDLSRIGRNNGKVLCLIDEFKRTGKNLILISEMGGVYDVQNDNDDCIGITTWFNERYVKDISRKVRANMLSKQKNAKLIQGNYYGYEKRIENGVPQLYVIEELRGAIELIYKLYVEDGLGRKKITDVLNSDKYNYPTPSTYYNQKHMEKGRVYRQKVQKLWSTDMIKNILENDVYCGNLRVHKKQVLGIRGKAIKLPESEHFVFENHHEAIVSKEVFKLAQELKMQRLKKKSTDNKRNYLFAGLCKCGDCKGGVSGLMIRRKNNVKAYECSTYRKYGKSRCKYHEVPEEDIIIHLKQYLKIIGESFKEEIKNINMEAKTNKSKVNRDKLQSEYDILNQEYKILLSQKIKDLIGITSLEQRNMIENTYKELEYEKQKRIMNLKKVLGKNDETIIKEKTAKVSSALDIFDEIIKQEEPSKFLINSILEKIYIYNNKTIKFILKGDITRLINS